MLSHIPKLQHSHIGDDEEKEGKEEEDRDGEKS